MIEQVDKRADDAGRAISPSTGAVTRLLQRAVWREPYANHAGVSGSKLERAELADGTRLVIKHISPAWDWIVRGTADRGREALVTTTGMLDRVADTIDHTVLAAEPEGDGWVIAMRDVSDAMIRLDTPVSRADGLRVLRAVARLHDAFQGDSFAGLVSLVDRYALFTPETQERVRSPFCQVMQRGWEVFVEIGPSDIVRAATTIRTQPEVLARELDGCVQTLIHGDLKYANVGLLPDRVILLDWGLAGMTPPEVDFAWYLWQNALRSEAPPEELLDDIREVRGDHFDARAMDLALIGVFVQMLPTVVLAATGERLVPPNADQPRAEARLAWWLERVARALETWSPV